MPDDASVQENVCGDQWSDRATERFRYGNWLKFMHKNKNRDPKTKNEDGFHYKLYQVLLFIYQKSDAGRYYQ